ncbi:MAG: metallophosphoesterase [DPANN group archaeon]|nr:metallophosphoesterase [DPANN group archaeon]
MIGIIADTHDNVANILKAVQLFSERGCTLVLHLGDVVAPATVTFFNGLNMRFIRGNCDGDIIMLRKKTGEIGGKYLGDAAELEIEGKRFFLTHGDDGRALEGAINSQRFDYILHGHTHVKRDEKMGKTRIINPGAHYFTTEHKTVALLDPSTDRLEFMEIL